MALPQYRNFSTSTTVPTASITPTNSPKSTAPRNKTASKSHKRPNQKKRALSSSTGGTHLAASKGGGQKLNYFDMKGFLAGGAAERPWFQLLMELAVAEDQDKVLHPADINRLVFRCSMIGNHAAAVEVHRNYRDAKFWPGRFLPTRQKYDIALRATNILLGLFRNEKTQHALHLITELSDDVGGRHTLFDLLLLQCADNGDNSKDDRGDGVRWLTVDDGLRVVKCMVSAGVRPTRIGMEALIDCCDAALDAETAEEIVRRMEEEYGLPPTAITIIRLLRACVNAGDEDRALRALSRLPREDLRSRDMQLLVMQTLLLQYEQAAESREAAEAPESMPRLRKQLDNLLLEIQRSGSFDKGDSGLKVQPEMQAQ